MRPRALGLVTGLLLLTSSLALAGCLGGNSGGGSGALDFSTIPTWKKGDRWDYNVTSLGQVVNTVTMVLGEENSPCPAGNGTCYRLDFTIKDAASGQQVAQDTNWFRRSDFKQVKEGEVDNSTFNFPLTPGKTWSSFGETCTAGNRSEVTVPAGKFQTIAIRCTESGATETTYYAPAARGPVKSTIEGPQGTFTIELVSSSVIPAASSSSAPASNNPLTNPIGTPSTSGSTTPGSTLPGSTTPSTSGNSGTTTPATGSLSAPRWDVGDSWVFRLVSDSSFSVKVKQEVVGANVPCGTYRCYEVKATSSANGMVQEQPTSFIEMTSLAEVKDGVRSPGIRFPVSPGDSYTADDGKSTCTVGNPRSLQVEGHTYNPVYPFRCDTEGEANDAMIFFSPETRNFVQVSEMRPGSGADGLPVLVYETSGDFTTTPASYGDDEEYGGDESGYEDPYDGSSDYDSGSDDY